jgi:hypothetical protein
MKTVLEQVEANMDSHGQLRPLAFSFEGERVHIVSYGRHWSEGEITHYLVMDHRQRVYQVGYDRTDNRWLMIRPPGDFGVPGKRVV